MKTFNSALGISSSYFVKINTEDTINDYKLKGLIIPTNYIVLNLT